MSQSDKETIARLTKAAQYDAENSRSAANYICAELRKMPMIDNDIVRQVIAALASRVAKEPGFGATHETVEALDFAHDEIGE